MLELKHISYAVREGDSELGILNDISLTIDDHRLVVPTAAARPPWPRSSWVW